MSTKLRSLIKIGILLLILILNFRNEPAFGMGNECTLQSSVQYSSNLANDYEKINGRIPDILPDSFVEGLAIIQQLVPVANAGGDQEICEDQVVNLVGYAQNFSVVSRSGGDGVFSAPNSLITTYTPGAGDKIAGNAELCLTAELIGTTTISVVDCLTVSIYSLPLISAGVDATTCETQIFETNPTLSNNFLALWTSSGDGFFDDDIAEVTNYTPGPTDLAEGHVELCLMAVGNLPCITEVTDCMILYFDHSPAVCATDDFSICTIGHQPRCYRYGNPG